MERALRNYINEIKSDVASLVYSDGEGAVFEDKFTEYCLEIFETIGKSEGARVLTYVHPNNQGGIDWKINGYCLKDQFKDGNKIYFETLDLFITHFRNEDYEYNITQVDYERSLNQIKKFINAALKKHIDYIDKSHTELNELLKVINQQGKDFDRINVYYLINGFSKHDKKSFKVNDIDVFVNTWDIGRLFKINQSNSSHEPIEIDFETFNHDGKGLSCLHVPSIDDLYDCYLAIVPGVVLAKLYNEYSSELLESNVRAFLGQTGKFNKGIRDTIRGNPQMFLPYNNGITATADSVETKRIDGKLMITKLSDFQIVNGGQTTASLYHTQKKYTDADLSKIFVQMKLTVIKDIDKKNIEIPFIARYANSQNKVSELDLSSNNPYFVRIENISRHKYVINPENKSQSLLWFFERANGQYKETLNKQTPARQKKFKEQSPSHMKFVKSDIAKYINLWDLQPHFVAQGSQKNFIHYTKKINELVLKNKMPGDNFYRKLIANAIVFKTVDKLFGRKNINAIGDTNLKSYTVAYTISYFHYLTANRLDLWKIYEEQSIDEALKFIFKELLVFVYDFLIFEAKNTLISEYAKRETSWGVLKGKTYPRDIIELSPKYFISEEESLLRDNEIEVDVTNIENTLVLVDNIQKLGIRFWDGFRKYIDDKASDKFSWDIAFDVVKKMKDSKNLNERELAYCQNVISLILKEPSLEEQVRQLSKLEDKEVVEVKFIYDKLLLLTKDDWNQIIDLASQTKIFDRLELANVKSIRSSLTKKDGIKEQALVKAYESLKKLRKFGIKV